MTISGAQAQLPHQRLVRVCGVLTAGLGGVALAGWALGLPVLTSLGAGNIPMAPSTALLFVLYGAGMTARTRIPLSGGTYWLGIVLYGTGALLTAGLALLSSQGIHFAAEHLGFTAVGTVEGAPIGFMSPVTAFGFLIASLSFLASLPPVSQHRWRAVAGWVAACLLLVGCCVFLLAYLYRTPLLYGGALIPPAATTCMAFATLGAGLLTLADAQAWPRGEALGPTTRPAASLIFVFVLVSVGIITAGYVYSRAYDAEYRAVVEHGLSSIAELKARELARYRQERLGDASTFYRNTPFSALVQRVFDHPADDRAQAQLRMWLRNYQTAYGYDRLTLLDADGVDRMSFPAAATPLAADTVRQAGQALRSDQIVFRDLYRNERDSRVYLTILVPIFEAEGDGRGLGVLALRVDPEEYLYPLISRWPTPSETAETLLVRRDGNDALILNERRFTKNTALTLRIPPARQESLAVKAILGHEGVVEGFDNRRVPVVADIRAIPDSPWFLIARVDASEAFAPLRERTWMMVLFIGFLLSGAAAGTAAAWRRQQAGIYRKLYEAERDRAWLRDVIALSSNEIYIFDPETLRISFANAGACENLGYTSEEMFSLTALDIKPDVTESFFRNIAHRMRAGEQKAFVFETVHRRKDGSDYPVEVHWQEIDTGSGPVVLSIVNDITERKAAESALRQSEERYRDLVEHSQELICTHDLEGRILSVNDAAIKLTGYSRDTLLRMNLKELLAPEVREYLGLYLSEIRTRGQAFGTMRIRTAGGEIRIWEYNNNLRTDGADGPIVRGMARDVTERQRAEERLTLLGTALDAAASAMVITDRQGIIRWVNRAFTELTGYRPEEAMGKNPGNLVKSGEHDPAFYEDMWNTILSGQVWRGRVVNRRKDGSLYTEEMTITPVRHGRGTITHFIATKEDITEKLQIEAQLGELQKMEVVGRLAGGVAHDFNNQIFVINGYCDLLLAQAAGQPAFLEALAEIKKAAQHSAQLTAQLLAFSRKQVLQPKVLDLNAELAAIETMLRRMVGEDVQLRFLPGEGVGHVRVDPNQLQRVVMNLAVNARDAMPSGGQLTIETNNVELDENYAQSHLDLQPGPYVLLSVSDTGLGMDRETLGHIFEPFFTSKEPGKGTGLGLATVQGIVKQSGGHITVYSEAGHGTIFRIYLPQVDGPVDDSERDVAEEAVGGSETILLVEDEDTVRELVRRVLEGHGYQVMAAAGGEEALQLVSGREEPIHLLLTDVVMPGLSGSQLAERLQGLHPETRVLYMSGYTEDGIVRHGLLQADLAFVPKPCPPGMLLRKVRETLNARRGLALGGKRILVVDDSQSERLLQERVLSKAGYAVLAAASGEEALEVLARETVDAVVTDVNMPVMDGFALTEAIRGSPQLRMLPVIVLSGALSEKEEARSRAVGATACLEKSTMDQQNLLDALAQCWTPS